MKRISVLLFCLVFFLLFSCTDGSCDSCAKILTDSTGNHVVELEKPLTAVCNLCEDSKYTADDITWYFGKVALPKESYTKLNKSAVSVTLNISGDINNPLVCKASKQDISYEETCTDSIDLEKGYPPLKPEELTCVALQDGTRISPELTCSWKPGTRHPLISTSYTLYARFGSTLKNVTSNGYLTDRLTVNLGTFPSHLILTVWVEAYNQLGTVKSDELSNDSEYFVKPNPPEKIRLIPEDSFPKSLMVNWTHPLHYTIMKLRYNIRYCKAGCTVWEELPQTLTKAYIQSFRLQNLDPYTEYVVQIRCIDQDGLSYWSNWSQNVTARTPQDRNIVELEKPFTAVCNLGEGSRYTTDDITCFLGKVALPRESYTKLNKSAVSVTLNISGDMNNPLLCKASKQDISYEETCIYGIYLEKGYPPLKPEELTCVALQDGTRISPELTCSWKPGTRHPLISTSYTLYARFGSTLKNVTSNGYPTDRLTINLGTFPSHLELTVWVEAHNQLGTVKSDELSNDSEYFVKPNPPEKIRLIPEDSFPKSLMVNWTHPLHDTIMKLRYNIRYCKAGCTVWEELPQTLTQAYIQSFRLKNLDPYTEYVVQIRCIDQDDLSYWSNWSQNVTARTPQDSSSYNCAKILPDSTGNIIVELEKPFTAVCNLCEGSRYTTDDITWYFGKVALPKESYTKLNKSAVSVTVNVSLDMKNPLLCKASKQDISYEKTCIYGIYLDKGYPPLKPEELTCVSLQNGTRISPELTCSWKPGTRHPLISTSYTLYARFGSTLKNVTSNGYPTDRLTVNLGTFPSHLELTVWVEAHNQLGTVKSDELSNDSEYFVKPNPPEKIRLIPEDSFPKSLMVNWTHPLHYTIMKLRYNIRYCKANCTVWEELPQTLTKAYIQSFRLQNLDPYTEYVVQIRCIDQDGLSYWSNWSQNVTARTPQDIPATKVDLWRVYEEDSYNTVKLIWKDPKKPNGEILGYNITINDDGYSETHETSAKELRFSLKGQKAIITITANNSVGISPAATLMIPRPGISLPPGVEQVNCSAHDGKLWVNWRPPPYRPIEYLIEWVSLPEKKIGWQRVFGNVNNVSFEDLEPFIRYNISVYPISRVRNHPGSQVTVQAYLQEGAPLSAPTINVNSTGKTTAYLTWKEIPIEDQRGFIINYTIIYKTKNIVKTGIVVSSSTYSYKLTDLDSDSHYAVSVTVSNQEGAVKGPENNFHTKKYEEGEIDLIVVVVCLCFLFFVVLIMVLIIKKREQLKRRFWPQVPDPSHSTIANWSPDCPNKADTPKESIQAEVSVVEVDMDDSKSLCDEDKSVMPLKKYFSEERSSGIGGSSGMSTPRQSVSSNDEADSGQTTASTVQYSAVVSSGYKGQTPGTQAGMFSRSESTQPLLECEENPEHMSEGSGHHTHSYFKRHGGLEQLHMDEVEEPSFSSLSFSPMEEEDSPTLTEDPPGPAPGYMPQQNGYRPQ